MVKAATTLCLIFSLLGILLSSSQAQPPPPPPTPQTTTIGFTVSCSSPCSPGLDGSDPVFVYFSIHFPGMDSVYEIVTELDAKSTGNERGEDTRDIAQKMKQDLDNAVCSSCGDYHFSQTHRNKIKIQWDGGAPGNARARIVVTGADHVNFGIKGDAGKIRWVALTNPVPPVQTKPGFFPTLVIRAPGEVVEGAKTKVSPPKKLVGKKVPHPNGLPVNREKFKDSEKVSKGSDPGMYVDEIKPWQAP